MYITYILSVSAAEHQNHAREIMRTFDVTTIHGIVISSGDGLLYEVSWEGMHVHNIIVYVDVNIHVRQVCK